jgi:hypothetical protein
MQYPLCANLNRNILCVREGSMYARTPRRVAGAAGSWNTKGGCHACGPAPPRQKQDDAQHLDANNF